MLLYLIRDFVKIKLSGKKKPAVFLDRDGVLNKSLIKNGKPKAPLLMKEFKFLHGVKKSINKLRKKFVLIIITNQPEIKKGRLKINTLNKMNKKIIDELKIKNIYVCPHDDTDMCKCRKPKNGLIESAIKKFNIDRKASFLIGDRKKDIDAGIKSKLKTIYIKSNYNELKPNNFDYMCKNLHQSLKYIK